MSRHFAFAILLLFALFSFAQQEDAPPPPKPAPTGERPRVFVTDSQSWEVGGGGGGTGGTFGTGGTGGARPQTAEVVKTFTERCPQVLVNNKRERADYVVTLDHEGGKSILAHDNKVAVFDAVTGDMVMSRSTLSLGGAVQGACEAIMKHWAEHGSTSRVSTVTPTATNLDASATVPPADPRFAISVDSSPQGADITVDGDYVASTPSLLRLKAGQHTITINKSGFKSWERKLTVGVGNVQLHAELEKSE
jgi:PEGA domain-containing protein